MWIFNLGDFLDVTHFIDLNYSAYRLIYIYIMPFDITSSWIQSTGKMHMPTEG